MCGAGNTTKTTSSAFDLALLLERELHTTPIAVADLRRLVRCHWEKVTTLAHAVHDEENGKLTGIRRAARNVAALSEDGIMNALRGEGAGTLQADFLILADAIKTR